MCSQKPRRLCWTEPLRNVSCLNCKSIFVISLRAVSEVCGFQVLVTCKIVGGLFKETWYSGKHCGYCGKQGDVSWSRAQKSILSRIFGELSIANDLLHGVGHSKRKVPLLMAITAAQTRLRNEGQVARKLCFHGALCREIQKGAAVAGQLRRSKQLVSLMYMDHSGVFIAGYDCALLLLALD